MGRTERLLKIETNELLLLNEFELLKKCQLGKPSGLISQMLVIDGMFQVTDIGEKNSE